MAGEPINEPQQRIRAGLTGLAVVFLLVLLGTAISRSSEQGSPPPNATANAVAAEPNEPLAEIGAAPSQAVNSGNAADSHKTP